MLGQGPIPHIVFANPAMTNISGYSVQELNAFTFQQTVGLVHPEDRELFFRRFKERLEGKPTIGKYVVRGIKKDGTIIWVELSSALIEYNGQPTVQAMFRDITEHKKASEELKKSELKYRSIFENSEAGMFRTTLDGSQILDCNEKFLRIFGRSRDEIIGKSSLVLWADPFERQDMVSQLKTKGFVEDLKCKMLNKQGEASFCLTALKLFPEEGILEGSIIDITERKKSEFEREIMIEFLRIVNSSTGTRDLIRVAVGFFQKQSGCEAIGVRLKDGDDYPYYETKGFPPEHVLLENKLCATDEVGCIVRDFKGDPVIECMCGNILCGRFDPSKKFFTEKGSFWTNDTTRFLTTTTDADRQIRTRNRCNGEGYESVALLALRVGNNRLGLLQLNDKRKNMFSLESIQMWERIADHLALALSKTLAEEKLREEDEKYRHLAEYAPAAIYEIDCKSMRFKCVNDYMCIISGYSEKELLSMSPFDLLNAESKEVSKK